ncbi:hypothetical protein P7K49_023627 [Saguinus oedipus]|uniref:Uncharacterized protein n=1 Tax=Saguinus oedipus TaxID=9490 RepID=A0ABQ9UM70_SAGOE|nr:hypothetical protein P7K49_023627 [Saguinus oedipus]
MEVAAALTGHLFTCLFPFRHPKLEKDTKEIPSTTQSPVSRKWKKKGFLPETIAKKHMLEDGTLAATSGSQPPGTCSKRNRTKAKVPSQANGMPTTKGPAPGAPTLSPSSPAKSTKLQKKNQKLSQVNGTPSSLTKPVGKKQHHEAITKKGVLDKSPPSTLAQKMARPPFVIRSPSLLQSETKKKTQLRKARKPSAGRPQPPSAQDSCFPTMI